ncbi:uncharacterized protein Tco025E_06871 [Trypanosoma conorhini]|uniref:DUF7623 domain-containing protein n=1 Tax=Trypanosoma conorhini TaxID=83891 RepID=A0A3R7KM03_9TRYP|nr:uncharacterized protein Tco025E_06871 [Trypanosoma conorhini]RNF10142.1 hypothetical protein Tco025E_06871 [Trypanosoma conorhini]
MRIRAEQLAADTLKLRAAEERAAARVAALYPYVDSAPLGVALWSLSVETDEQFCALLRSHGEALEKKAGSVRETESALNARAQAMAKALLEEEEALATALPFLGRSVKGVPLRELALMSDTVFAELAERHAQEASSGDAAGRSRLEQDIRDQAGRIAREVRAARRLYAVRGEDLLERYPFLPEEPVRGVLLGDVRPVQQPPFRELSNRLDELRRDPARNAAAIRTMEEQMAALVVRLAEERAEATRKTQEQFPFLPRRVLGVRLGDLPLHEDDMLAQLARRRSRQLKYASNVKDVNHTEEEMVKRAEELARSAKLVEAHRMKANEYVRARNPFLVYEDRKCVPLSEIPLAGDAVYQGLFREHLAALADAEANAAQITGLEDALRSRADELALGECEKESQLTMYSFLGTHNVPGWSDALLRDVEFQQLRNRYDELSKDPQGNAKALRELEDAMDARGRAVAEELRTAEAGEAAGQPLHATHAGVSPVLGHMKTCWRMPRGGVRLLLVAPYGNWRPPPRAAGDAPGRPSRMRMPPRWGTRPLEGAMTSCPM